MGVEDQRLRSDPLRLPIVSVVYLETGGQNRSIGSSAEKEVQSVFLCSFKPVLFIERSRKNADDCRKAIKGHVGLCSTPGTEVDMDMLTASFTYVLVDTRLPTLQDEVLFFENRFD